jgi:response regulator RpfG family c-di-GMP phosphodiesterase
MLTILMIDDDKGDVEILRTKISNIFTGLDFMAVFGHKMGLWKLNRFRPGDEDLVPDAIIHEASFADGSSVEIVRSIRGSKLLSRVPVLIYTGTDDEETKRSCLVAGATKIFPKGPGTQGAEALAAYVVGLARKD